MSQLSFFDDEERQHAAEFQADLERKRLARCSDDQTSHEAAAKIEKKLGQLHRVFLNALGVMGEGTAEEVARACGGNPSVRKRAAELLQAGKIEVVSRRVCRVTGNRARVFRVND